MNNKRRLLRQHTTKQAAMSLTSRQRAYRLRLPDEKAVESKTTNKAKANKR